MADHVLTEAGDRLLAEDGQFIVLALDIIGTPKVYIFTPAARQRIHVRPDAMTVFPVSPRPRLFTSPSRGAT